MLSTIGLGGENRTPTYGFGDRGSAIKLHRDTGADNQIRTDDLNVGNVSHYHCAIPALSFYAAKLLKRSAAYDAANAFGLISGTTLHVPLI